MSSAEVSYYQDFVMTFKSTQNPSELASSSFAQYVEQVQENERVKLFDEIPHSGQESMHASFGSGFSNLLNTSLIIATLALGKMFAGNQHVSQESGKKKKKAEVVPAMIETQAMSASDNVSSAPVAAAAGLAMLATRRGRMAPSSLRSVLPLTLKGIRSPSLISVRNFSASTHHINSTHNAAPSSAALAQPSAPLIAEDAFITTPSFTVYPMNPATSSAPSPAPASKLAPPRQEANKYAFLTDQQICSLVSEGKIQEHQLESVLGDLERAVRIRRSMLLLKANLDTSALNSLPFQNFDYAQVNGQCCENVLGYVPMPVGVVGPMKLNGKLVFVPLATTEGCLVASTQRGAKAITESGGAQAVVVNDGMTRAPLVRFASVKRSAEVKEWIEKPENMKAIAEKFQSTGRFAKLKELKIVLAGRNLYLRFRGATGDAMGMNMISKGVEAALDMVNKQFPDMQIMSLSGNYCTDKKPSAVNWIEGRGKSVVCEATITGDIVEKVLKTTVKDLVDLNINKNYIGSIMAGSIGGFNAHASNIVTAVYLACGQDPAQNVESSNCLTQMEAINDGKDLYITVTMPSIEVGTVGGGTGLPAQSACLDIMGLKGASQVPGEKPRQLAMHVAATVMAGELSLMSALAAGHLVKSHMRLNRKKH